MKGTDSSAIRVRMSRKAICQLQRLTSWLHKRDVEERRLRCVEVGWWFARLFVSSDKQVLISREKVMNERIGD